MWMLVKWQTKGLKVIHADSIRFPTDRAPRFGETLLIEDRKGLSWADLIACASDRAILEALDLKRVPGSIVGSSVSPSAGPSVGPSAGSSARPNVGTGEGPSVELKQDEEPEDYCSSTSSWAPSDDDRLSDDSDMEEENNNLGRRRRHSNKFNGKVLGPSNKENLIHMSKNIKPEPSKKAVSNGRAGKRCNSELVDNLCRDIIEADNIIAKMPDAENMPNKAKQSVKYLLRTLSRVFRSIKIMKKRIEARLNLKPIRKREGRPTVNKIKKPNPIFEVSTGSADPREPNGSEHEEFDRSDDNVLISNKYTTAPAQVGPSAEPEEDPNEEMVRIGSGITLIPKIVYKKINWKSYTVATRGLLMAVFPRRVLATHCLTGKSSPAFLEKPAKMCLDPKSVSDIVLEVMDRFKIRENLVRSCITTKCADEAKMMRMRKKKLLEKKKNKEGYK